MRVLLDTNVLVSGLLWRGRANALLWRLRERPDTVLLTSPWMIDELRRTLDKPKLRQALGAAGTTPDAIWSLAMRLLEAHQPQSVPSVVEQDPDGDHVLAAAIAGRADWLVTGDRALLRHDGHEGVRILTVAKAVARLDSP